MAEQGIKLAGPVEIDDAVFGGSDSNKHREPWRRKAGGRGDRSHGSPAARSRDAVVDAVTKVVVEAVVPRKSCRQPRRSTATSILAIRGWAGWARVTGTRAVSRSKGWVNAARRVDANSRIDLRLLGPDKRGIGAVYRQVGRGYLQSYLNEYSFRTNRRFAARPMFAMLVERGVEQVVPAVWETRRLAAAGLPAVTTLPTQLCRLPLACRVGRTVVVQAASSKAKQSAVVGSGIRHSLRAIAMSLL